LVADVADALHVLLLREPATAIAVVAKRLAGFGMIGIESNHDLQMLFALFGEAGFLAPLGHIPLRLGRIGERRQQGFVLLIDVGLDDYALDSSFGQRQADAILGAKLIGLSALSICVELFAFEDRKSVV